MSDALAVLLAALVFPLYMKEMEFKERRPFESHYFLKAKSVTEPNQVHVPDALEGRNSEHQSLE